jgi:hypothetical protein
MKDVTCAARIHSILSAGGGGSRPAGAHGLPQPTVTFTLLYCLFVIGHGRRKILHFIVTRHPLEELAA